MIPTVPSPSSPTERTDAPARQPKPLVAAVDMGYGHLRAAYAIAEAAGTQVALADRPPLASPEERRRWDRARRLYEWTSRVSQTPYLGRPFRSLLGALTHIPELHPYRDLSHATFSVRLLRRHIAGGLGGGLVRKLREEGGPLCSTFYAPAIAAAAAGCERIHCVVTDTDLHRIWAPDVPRLGRIHYFVPSQRALRRLVSYGVPQDRIEVTGFPLPVSLLGDDDLSTLRQNLARRLVRLDPQESFRSQYRQEIRHFLGIDLVPDKTPPLLVFAIGGAGAQAEIARDLLRGIADSIRESRIRLALVAGTRGDLAEELRKLAADYGFDAEAGGKVSVLFERDFASYYASFNRLLAEADILWTKPSELTFYAALGIPLIFAWPVGHHEKCNRRWAIEAGAGMKQGSPRYAMQWIGDWLQDGTLAGAAWSGFMRLPKFGTRRILEGMGVSR